MRELAIYLHIPFCKQKCFYCDFNSFALKDYSEITQYVCALKTDIKEQIDQLNTLAVLKTIYFGGGTPSLLKPAEIESILSVLKKYFPLKNNCEITIEANPGTVSYSQLTGYKQAGVNRLSLGAQSFQDKYLKFLGRVHRSRDVLESLRSARRAGFTNISIDLIYGLDRQDIRDWEKDLERFLKLDLEHISFYDLKIEKGTRLYELRHTFKLTSQDMRSEMYQIGCEKLENAGYSHYEISSFAKKNKESRHNQIYWKNEEYIGCGAGAYSYLAGKRFGKNKNVRAYIKNDFTNYDIERLDEAARINETIVLNLRLLSGFDLKDFFAKYTSEIVKAVSVKLDNLAGLGLIEKNETKYRLSKKGILFYDTVAGEILD